MSVSIDTSDLVAKGVRFEAELRRESHTALVFVAHESLARIRGGTYWKSRPDSEVTRSFDVRVRSSTQVFVESRNKIAFFLNGGTRPHTIRPKADHGIGPVQHASQGRRGESDIGTARVALRFFVNGRTVFAKTVNHPGTKAINYEKTERDLGEHALGRALMTSAEHAADRSGLS